MRNGLPPGQEAGCHGNGGNPAGKRQPMDRPFHNIDEPGGTGQAVRRRPRGSPLLPGRPIAHPGVVESARDGIVVTRCADCGARDRWGGLPTGSIPAP